jgi:sensor histidine kinase YesM
MLCFINLDSVLLHAFIPSNNGLETSIGTSILNYLFFCLASFAHIILIRWQKQQDLKQMLIQEKISSELNHLKAQINPHFLFNALNNLLSIAEENNQIEISKGIENLSEMLRFSLHEMVDDLIPLTKEIQFIESYIELIRLKYADSDPIEIKLYLKDINENTLIAPAVLFPFVENALKHGLNIEEASFVIVELQVRNNQLLFSCKNSIFESTGYESGIGLENVRKRLELLYHQKHTLSIKKEKNIYHVDLTLITDVGLSNHRR